MMTEAKQYRVWVYGNDINTDEIFPGKYTYTLRTPEEIASVALEDLDPTFKSGVKPGDLIVAGRNWGCGSSREQAVTTLKYNGVTAIIAESFNGLYFRNCINQGILPLITIGLCDTVSTGDIITLDHASCTIRNGTSEFAFSPLSDSAQAIIDAGGLLPMLQRRFQTT
jgi:3-isopropylmalate/(R)-2-methylmalate dehydratase small subunit